ncbi:MAG: EAL domain-containing protein [Steroidobacteraceae bacterium]
MQGLAAGGKGVAGRATRRAACACVFWALCALASAAAPADPAAPKLIRVASDGSYPPYIFVDADGAVRGYEADMWRLFEAHTGIRVEFMPTGWAAAMQNLRDGRADILDLIYHTPSREAQFDFSEPYASVPNGVYVDRRIRGVRDVASLRGFPVGVQREDACAEKLRAAGFTDLRFYPDYQDIIQAALHDDLRIFCMDENAASYYLYRESALDRFSQAFVLFTGELHRAVRKGDGPLLQVVEQGMAQVTPAERALLHEQWLEQPFVLRPYLRTAQIVLAAAAVVIALMLLWVWLLRRTVARHTHALREEQGKLRALFDASPDGMWVKDRAGVHLECNDRTSGLFPFSREQLLGATDAQLFDAQTAAMIRGWDEDVMRHERPRTVLFPFAQAGGGTRQVEIVKVPLYAPDGSVRGVLSVGRDITARLQVEERAHLWAHAFRHAAFGVEICDLRTRRIIEVNPAFARDHGYTVEEMAGMPIDALYADEQVARETANAGSPEERQAHLIVESEHVTRDGRRFPVLLDCSVFNDADGNPHTALVYVQDMTARKHAQDELRLAAVAFESQDALLVLAPDGTIQRVNEAFTLLTGFQPHEVIGRSSALLGSPVHDQAPLEDLFERVRDRGIWQGERWVRVNPGQSRVVRSTLSAVLDKAGQVSNYVLAMVDLTNERDARARVDQMTYFDALTDLPNRNFLLGHLSQLLGANGFRGGALLLFDLDRFKSVNDLRGHAAGDRLLILVARRARGLMAGEDMLCRFNGGTFAWLLPGEGEGATLRADRAQQAADRLRRALQEPFDLGDETPVTLSVSIGWTELAPGPNSPDLVLREAELAMYRAKAAGRDEVFRYEPAMQAELVQREAMIQDLRLAIAQDSLHLHLQAQFDRRGAIVGAEALLRWTRPDGQPVSPGVFIPIAEESGLIVPLGDWVLRRACGQLADWAQHPLARRLSLAVNVSARQFTQPGFVDGVRAALAQTGADPWRLKLEVTESMIMGDLSAATARLTELRALGIRIALDDFGTGYSSLAYLSRLPLDQLKIDQSFVARLPDDPNDTMVTQSIIGIGHGLGLEVIAEGVETEAQWKLLMEQRCDAFQGFLLGRPVPGAEFEAILG